MTDLVFPEATLRLADSGPGARDLPATALLAHELVAVTKHLRCRRLGREVVALSQHDLGRLLLELVPRDRDSLLYLLVFSLAPLPIPLFGGDPSRRQAQDVVAVRVRDSTLIHRTLGRIK